MSEPIGLEALNAQVRRDLEYLDHFSAGWVRSRPDVLDALIVGGG